MIKKPVVINFLQRAEQIKNSFLKSRLSRWVLGHLPECAIFLLGVYLRLTMSWRYQAPWGYDWPEHLAYTKWLFENWSLPSYTVVRLVYHPPLYYAAAAGLMKLGSTEQGLIWLSISCGIVRLALIWIGLELYLQRRWARVAGLALAAVLSSSIQIDGMVYNDTMACTFSVAAMVLWPQVFRTTGRRRWMFACALGLVFGMGGLAKLSPLVLLAPLGIAVMLNLFAPSGQIDWRMRLKGLLPWSAMILICLAVAGWFYARNVPRYRNPFITSYEYYWGPVRPVDTLPPLMDRRTLGFVLGWNLSTYRQPYYPSGLYPHARFFPVALASSFVDYYNYSFSGIDPKLPVEANMLANSRPVTPRLMRLSRRAVLGGAIILLGTLAAWAICLWRTFRKDWGLFALLLAPMFATLLALLFAVKYPYDNDGIIKGVYMQFGMAPLFAMFGLSVDWAMARRRRWPILAVLLFGLFAVGAYTICCRTGFRL
jgi:Dolichyl-phosphate-mannose-protein mannosyltransferase